MRMLGSYDIGVSRLFAGLHGLDPFCSRIKLQSLVLFYPHFCLAFSLVHGLSFGKALSSYFHIFAGFGLPFQAIPWQNMSFTSLSLFRSEVSRHSIKSFH